MPSNSYPRRSKRNITFHSRTGKPMIHQASNGKLYIMVRAKRERYSGGGTRRLYDGSLYSENGTVRRLSLKGM